MNRYLSEEIFVTDIEIMPDNFKNSMSLLRAADYMIIEKEEKVFPENWQEKWREFVSQDSILVMKKTKKSVKEMDVRPHILAQALTIEEFAEKTGENYGELHCPYKEGGKIFMKLTSGSEINIKPEFVMDAFYQFCEKECPPFLYQVHRLQMYFADSGTS